MLNYITCRHLWMTWATQKIIKLKGILEEKKLQFHEHQHVFSEILWSNWVILWILCLVVTSTVHVTAALLASLLLLSLGFALDIKVGKPFCAASLSWCHIWQKKQNDILSVFHVIVNISLSFVSFLLMHAFTFPPNAQWALWCANKELWRE